MSFGIRPILSALSHNPFGPALVALQAALTLAVMANASYIVKQRLDAINTPTGMDVGDVLVISSSGFTGNFDDKATLQTDLAYLRGVHNVVAATAMNAVPLSGMGRAMGVKRTPGSQGAYEITNVFQMDEQGLSALGLQLSAGRGFRAEEILPPPAPGGPQAFVPQVIVTNALARSLFPQGDALGKVVYDPLDRPTTIIGIVDRMRGAWVDFAQVENVMLEPRAPSAVNGSTYYFVRSAPGLRDQIMRTVEGHMLVSNPDRVIDWILPLEQIKLRTYATDRSTVSFLVAVTILLLCVTGLGIFGLATFNIRRRIKQIGTWRALGARQRDILYYYMVENGMITAAGAIAGCVLAVAVGYWLSLEYGLPRLDLYYLGGGVLTLCLIGQLGAWWPARRAASVHPAEATRVA